MAANPYPPQAPAAQMKPRQKTAGNWELPALTRPLAALESEGPAGGLSRLALQKPSFQEPRPRQLGGVVVGDDPWLWLLGPCPDPSC